MVKGNRRHRQGKSSRSITALFAFLLVLFLGTAPAAGSETFGAPEGETERPESDGLDYSFITPPALEDVRVYDKSMPLPEVFRKIHEGSFHYFGSSYIFDENSAFPLPINEDVQAWIDQFTVRGRGGFQRWMERGGMYEHIIIPELRKRGMPEELFYLCMIESGFNPRAASWAGAKGLWQFIRSTGQRYGLRIDYWVDERYDPEKATSAALDYLTFLHARYRQYNEGAWHLAAAAYNTGEGNVDRAIERNECSNYWDLCEVNALHRETRGYVPKMVAAAIVGKHPEAYGFYGIHKMSGFRYATVTIDSPIDLRVAARCAGVSTSEIERLNPEILQYCTPPGKSYKLHVPTTRAGEFRSAYAALSPNEKIAFKTHVVAKGETVKSIAAGYGTNSKMLAAVNNRPLDSGLIEGQEILVPVPPDREYQPSRRPPPEDTERPRTSSGSSGTRKKKTYTLEPGDTLWDVARATGVSVSDLKRWNNIKDPTSLQEGDQIVLYAPSKSKGSSTRHKGKTKTITYTVRPGDSCYYIARYYGIRTSEIIEQNRLGSSCTIKPGQKLTLTVPRQAPSREPPTARGEPSSGGSSSGRSSSSTYVVKKGDTLGGIAQAHGVSVAQLKDWNNLDSASIKPGQKLVVKRSSGGSSGGSSSGSSNYIPKPARGKKVTHTVKSGESLWAIARAYDVRVADIKAWNNLETEAVKPGKKLVIYPGASAGATTAASSGSSSSASSASSRPAAGATSTKGKKKVTYTVKNGESLWGIARAHDVHVADIKAWNNLTSDSVKPGQKLVIYVE